MTPADRYSRDASALFDLSQWIENRRLGAVTMPRVVALDYFTLADKLQRMADDARAFARVYVEA